MTRTDSERPTLVILAGGRARRYGGVKPLAPVGPGGEAVIDLLGSDAIAAGFSTLVLVIGPATGPAIRYHVERTWPGDLDVRFAVQDAPLGTVHAVLSAAEHLPAEGGSRGGFGVANADDLYGQEPLALLAAHLTGEDPANALVAFRLHNSIVGHEPVTRGLCTVDGDGLLEGVDERRHVVRLLDGRFVSEDGREPAELSPDALVSMNLWGFRPALQAVFEAAMADASLETDDAEVLLPEVVGEIVAGQRAVPGGATFRVVPAEGRCVGVTHPSDLALVQTDLCQQVGRGDRPAALWEDRSAALG